MRLLLTFDLKSSEMVTDYRSSILSFFKKALHNTRDGMYFEEYYRDTIQKDFTWSLQLKKPRFLKETIQLESKEIRLLFSADENSKTGYIFFLALSAMKRKEFPLPHHNAMVLKEIRQLKEEVITGNTCVFKSALGSPIVVRNHDPESNKDHYITIEDKEFNKELTDTIRRQLEKNTNFHKDSIDNVEVECMQGKKVVVKHYGHYIDTTAGMFVIKAEAPILRYIYNVGAASRKSLGFGALELISQLEYE